jgi:hypothetical protein
MMDRAEWTRQIEAEVAELRRDLKTMWNVWRSCRN